MKYFSMKNTYFFFLPFLSLLLLSCQMIKGSGNPATRELKINGVKKIHLRGIGKLVITQADEESLIIRADDNILPHIKSSVSGDELLLKVEKNISISPVTPLVFNVSIKDLSDISVSGTSSIEVKTLNTEHLNLNLKGGTYVTGERILLKNIYVKASGSNMIKFSGQADTQTLVLRGSSRFDGTNLNGKNAVIDASGYSSIKLNVSEKISGSISGSTKVKHKQHPITDLKTSGRSAISSF